MTVLTTRTQRQKLAVAFPPPSSDQRWQLLEVAMKRHQFRQDALIEVLHAAQWLSLTAWYMDTKRRRPCWGK